MTSTSTPSSREARPPRGSTSLHLGLRPAVGLGGAPRARLVQVQQQQVLDLLGLGQVAHDGRGDDARPRPERTGERSHRHQLPAAQGQPELDPVARGAQVAAGQLLHLADPVAQRVAVAEQLPRRPLPLAVLLDEGLQRADQLVAVLAAALLERAQHALAVERQRLVVLEGQQQLEGAEVAVGGHRRGCCRRRSRRPPARSGPR